MNFCQRAWRQSAEAALSLFYPPHCAACSADTAAGCHLCEQCASGVREIRAPFCQRCSESFDGAITGAFTCANCAHREFTFEAAVSRFRSEGVVREFIHRFKYERQFYLRHQLGDWLAAAWLDERIQHRPVDYLIPVPLHSARRREREFNQAEVLARILGKRTGTPVLEALRRNRYTSTQTRLNRRERMENLHGAFELRHNSPVQSRHLIIVDDVFTTGSTVEECARVLSQAGAESIRVVTVARG